MGATNLLCVFYAFCLFHTLVNVASGLNLRPRVVMEQDVKKPEPTYWSRQERANKDMLINLIFAVKQQNLDLLKTTLLRVSDPTDHIHYGKHLKMEEVNALVAPHPESIHVVTKWLHQHGITNYRGSSNFDFILVTTTIAVAEGLLQTEYYKYEHSSGSSIVRCTGYTVPVSVSMHIDFVAPTIRFPVIQHTKIIKKQSRPNDEFVTPQFLKQLYQIPNNTHNVSPSNVQAVASFLEQYYSPNDLEEFFKLFAPDQSGQKVAKQIGDNIPSEPGTEAELDVQYLMSVGSHVPTWVYYTAGRAPNPANEPFLDWITNVSMSSSIPLVFSVSYGEDEKSVGLDYASRVNVEFQKVGVRGTSIMFASGDSGAGGNCSESGRLTPNFPTGSPWVTSVGGVTGGKAGSTPTGEVTDFISGGGFSDYWATPDYQKDAVKYYLSNAQKLPNPATYNATGRGYPDVAAQSEAYVVVQDGIPLPGVSGTSCATPTFSGVISLLNDLRLQKGKSPLGFLNPFIYNTASTVENSFNDVTEGFNEGCAIFGFPAHQYWDAATGWGSPNYSILKNVVENLP